MRFNMPLLQPLPIFTKRLSWYKALYVWMTTIRRWRVTEDYYYSLSDSAMIVIPKGFKFDGASIPRIFWGLLSPTGLLLIPGLLHDYAYKFGHLIQVGHDRIEWPYGEMQKYYEDTGRAYWDRMFRDEAIRVNGFHIINYIAWLALRAGGWLAWNKHRRADEGEGDSNS